MTTAVFDTLKASDTLKAAGIEAKQAEAIVHTMAGAFEDTVATKSDVVAIRADMGKLETSIRADMDKLEASVKAEMAAVKADMDKLEASVKADLKQSTADLKADLSASLYRMLLAQLAVAGVLFAALKLF